MEIPTRTIKNGHGKQQGTDWLRVALAAVASMEPSSICSAYNELKNSMLDSCHRPRGRYPSGLQKHSFVEVCIPLTGQAVFEIGKGRHGILPPLVIIVTPDTLHCECYAKWNTGYSLLWMSVSGPALVAHVSRYRAREKWDCPAHWHLRSKYAHRLFDRFTKPDKGKELQSPEQTQCDVLAILSRLYEQDIYCKTRPVRKGSGRIERYVPMLLNLRTFIDNHLENSLSLEELAGLVGLSPNYLNYLFSLRYGEAIHTHIINRRMELALQLCRQGNMLIKQIARKAGYEDPLYFSRAFYRYHGQWPSEVFH